LFYHWPAVCIARGAAIGQAARESTGAVMDPKLAFLVLLFGAIIGLAQVGEERMARIKHQFGTRLWRRS
jgi:hypothetical protein